MEPSKKYSRDEVGQLVARYYRSETDGAEVHALARGLQIENPSLTYRDALRQILQIKSHTDDSNLSPARREMNELLGDRAKTRYLAGLAVDKLANARAPSRYSSEPRQSYRAALEAVKRDYPNLWRAYENGTLLDGDFRTLKLLTPSSSEIERRSDSGNYADETTVKKYDFPA